MIATTIPTRTKKTIAPWTQSHTGFIASRV